MVTGGYVEMSDAFIRARGRLNQATKLFYALRKHGLVEMTFERRVAELGKTCWAEKLRSRPFATL